MSPEIGHTTQDVLVFLAFFVPGFIMSQTYELFVPSGEADWQKRLPAVISYSAMYYALTLWVVLIAPRNLFWFLLYGDVFGGPVIVGLITVLVRRGSLRVRIRPQATPWDELFARVSTMPDGAILTVNRKSGEPLIGYFGALSYAAAFPRDHELYVQAICEIREGEIRMQQPPRGFLITMSDILYITFQAAPTDLA